MNRYKHIFVFLGLCDNVTLSSLFQETQRTANKNINQPNKQNSKTIWIKKKRKAVHCGLWFLRKHRTPGQWSH